MCQATHLPKDTTLVTSNLHMVDLNCPPSLFLAFYLHCDQTWHDYTVTVIRLDNQTIVACICWYIMMISYRFVSDIWWQTLVWPCQWPRGPQGARWSPGQTAASANRRPHHKHQVRAQCTMGDLEGLGRHSTKELKKQFRGRGFGPICPCWDESLHVTSGNAYFTDLFLWLLNPSGRL